MNFLASSLRAWFAAAIMFSFGSALADEDKVSVSDLVLTTSQTQQGTTATATITVVDQAGAPVVGARVTGSWTGLTTAQGSALTNQKGRATFHSTRSKDKGTFVFNLGTVSAMGATYEAALNAKTRESVDSIGITE
ncbi:MAG: carbohydrate-binding protein [Verrucomicrobiaceae bacterium]|nr:carbohydrate-binding protein [Verrucomicrobiaceae bacterium]MDB6117011.1 carbohydrate-binding protein [Verrucomicrobiaceae bacterium]